MAERAVALGTAGRAVWKWKSVRRGPVNDGVTQQPMHDQAHNLWPRRRMLALLGLAFFVASYFCPISHRYTSLEGDRESFYSPDLFTSLFSDSARVGLGGIIVGLNLAVAALYIVLVSYPNFPLLTVIRRRRILGPVYAVFSVVLIVATVLGGIFLIPIALLLVAGFRVIGSGGVFWFLSVVALPWIVRSSVETRDRVPPQLFGLKIICTVVGCYGVGFGAFLLLVAAYFGPTVLLTAIAHILFGSGFLASAVGINANRHWAHWAIITLSMILVFVSVLEIAASVAQHDVGSAVLWGIVFTFFMAIAVGVFRRPCVINGESNPAQRCGEIAHQYEEPECG